jgi:hypothetical protein
MDRLGAIAGAGVVVALAGCVGRRVDVEVGNEQDPAAVLGARPVMIPGEDAVYALTMLEMPIGVLEMRVGSVEERDGRPVAWVSTVIETDGVVELVTSLRDEVSTLLDLGTGRPVATRGTFKELLTGRPDPDANVEAAWAYPEPDHHNGHTLILALRGWDATPGARAVTTLHSRTNRNEVEVVFVGGEDLPTALGQWPAVRVDGTIFGAASDGDPFHFSLWVADDTSRAVLRLDSDTDLGLVASARIVDYSD